MDEITPELTIKVTNDAGNVIDIVDKETGHLIATRQLDNAGAAGALGFLFKIDGRVKKGILLISQQIRGALGITEILAPYWNYKEEKNGKGGFQQIFFNIVSKVGSQVKSGKLNVEAAEVGYEGGK